MEEGISMLEHIGSIITIIVFLAPVAVKLLELIAQKTSNVKIDNLSARATKIVTGLSQSGLTNEEKKMVALDKLAFYANEVGIKVTGDQLDDYIESAYVIFKTLKDK